MNSKQQPEKAEIQSIEGSEKGLALITSIVLVALLAIVGTISVNTTYTDIMISGNYKDSVRAFYAAEGGAEYGLNQLRQRFSTVLDPGSADLTAVVSAFNTGITGTNTAMSDYTFGTFTVLQTLGAGTVTPITTGNYAGLSALIDNYDITTEAGTGTASARIVISAEDYLIPLFQFAVFYDDDLEIHPGPDMTFDNGWIHSNSDIYLGAENTLTIDSKTTSAGDILYSRKTTGSEQNVDGVVQFTDAGGVDQAMKQDDDLDGNLETEEILDSTRSDWVIESQSRWGGNVKSGDHGISSIDLVPMPSGSDEIEIIKEGDDYNPSDSAEISADPDIANTRYYWKAGLRILNGTAYDQAGVSVDLTNGGAITNPISNETFWDAREEAFITVTTIDMELLGTNSMASPELSNGILYVSESAPNKGVRLIKGHTLPAGGFTVASENPIYIQGDYNTANVPAAVLGDAVTILSNNWDDTNDTSYGSRNAIATTINTAIVSGNVESTLGGDYSGGLENLPRYLENWAGITLNYSGSVVCLWQSEKATASWGKSNVYYPPDRNWSYGMDVNNMPPGTPFVRVVSKVGWYHDIN
ncbi:MAG: hypothetical protein D8M57_04615 [Candidatus Scalindua sp. AMX11]|nr:MAG: hypothetical protein DWQ00_03980 [Candidatus Scalindua sp.]NOG84603.1 hypothetical protein [Planctomycetota bacterium]RZV92378.1 MAG: hypothetical protein EX341_04835 [Candidatus Scalindua sp. SCAELEC01]TDE66097.1 MAG: hypothetical protein D8M57_04615 [Candidatus Scalindua sp. AMX11]GJQ59072.1 MAG: hypothetical protein SCALA701_18730 [Candidatus Scalindua sp.]